MEETQKTDEQRDREYSLASDQLMEYMTNHNFFEKASKDVEDELFGRSGKLTYNDSENAFISKGGSRYDSERVRLTGLLINGPNLSTEAARDYLNMKEQEIRGIVIPEREKKDILAVGPYGHGCNQFLALNDGSFFKGPMTESLCKIGGGVPFNASHVLRRIRKHLMEIDLGHITDSEFEENYVSTLKNIIKVTPRVASIMFGNRVDDAKTLVEKFGERAEGLYQEEFRLYKNWDGFNQSNGYLLSENEELRQDSLNFLKGNERYMADLAKIIVPMVQYEKVKGGNE